MNERKYTGINKFIKSGMIQTLFDKKKEGTLSEFFDDWKWIFSYSSKYKWIIVLYTVLGILSSSFSLGAAYISRILINVVVSKQMSNLWLMIFLIVASTVVSVIFTSLMSRISAKISIRVNNDIQAEIFDSIIDSSWEELNKYFGGDILNRFNSDVSTISNNAIAWIPNLIINIYTFILTFIVLIRMDLIMALIALLAGPFLLLISRAILSRMRAYKKRVLELNSSMMSFEVETFFNFDMIKSFGIINYYSAKLRDWQKKYKDYNLDYNKFEIKTNIIMTIMSSFVALVAMLYCVFLLWTDRILFGDMTFFIQQRELLTGKFNSLVSTFPGMVNSAVSAHRVRELVELKKEYHNPESLSFVNSESGVSVVADNITFAYRENEFVYSDSDFCANPGEIVAILGSSGGGKTTLMRMILGLIYPSTGEVSIVDSNKNAVKMNADLRSLFSYVPQGNTVLSGTIADNMRMVKEDATDEEIIEALKVACAWDFVEQMPNGIYSKLNDNGKGISMGQGQRISIARAMLRNAPIILLDEATSALDIDTEREVLNNIIKKQPNRTYIIATHRPSVLNQSNRVYRILDKKIVELDRADVESILKEYTGT